MEKVGCYRKLRAGFRSTCGCCANRATQGGKRLKLSPCEMEPEPSKSHMGTLQILSGALYLDQQPIMVMKHPSPCHVTIKRLSCRSLP